MIMNNKIYLTEKQLKEHEEICDRIMDRLRNKVDLSDSKAKYMKRGFMAEAIFKTQVLGIPLEKAMVEGPDGGYDYVHDGLYGRLLLDVKSGYRSSSQTIDPYHELRIGHYKNKAPDALFVFISATDVPTVYIIEGAITHKEIMSGIMMERAYRFEKEYEKAAKLPMYVAKGQTHGKYTYDSNTIILPALSLTSKGYAQTMQTIFELENGTYKHIEFK